MLVELQGIWYLLAFIVAGTVGIYRKGPTLSLYWGHGGRKPSDTSIEVTNGKTPWEIPSLAKVQEPKEAER